MSSTLGRARGLLAGFTPGQRGVIAVAAIALVLGAVGLSRWAAQPAWTPLFSNLSGSDANAIVEQLRADSITYQLADGGGTVLVPQSQVYDVRVSLAGKGLPSSDSDGYSILDSQGMTATDFQQSVAYRRALESELGKTLQAITGVQTAIVHLALPKRDVFATEQDRPTASVLLALKPGTNLSDSQVRSITHLVAGSVEGLDPGDVNVSDSKGNLLSTREDGADGAASRASSTDQQTAKFEDRMSSSVQQMLDRVLGPGKAVVRVNAQLNFDTRDTTSERYVSESPAPPPLSEATARETYGGGGTGSGGNLGVTYPTLTPAAGVSGGANYLKENRTVDNAVGKIVERAQAAPGAVQRLTVAVVLDAKAAGALDPTKVQALVSNAVGLDPKRGDTVQVDTLAFDNTASQAAAKELATAAKAERTAGYLDLGKKAGIGLLVLVALILMSRRRKGSTTVDAVASDLPGSPLLVGDALEQAAIGAGPEGIGSAVIDPAQEQIQLGIERDRIRDEVAELVDNQPDEVAAVIQGWLSERKA
jgi:flagellar M-ring protein FliF